MEKDLLLKIKRILHEGSQIVEDEVRSLMILVRKRLELTSESARDQYLTLNLFCNWAAHTKITQSITGLKVLARINDALLEGKNGNGNEVQATVSRAIGFDTLYSEMLLFLQNNQVPNELNDPEVWQIFLRHVIEIIRDVPLAFPPATNLKKAARAIYKQVVQNPIKPGAGVVSIKLSNVDYDALGAKGIGEILCLILQLEDRTQIVVPFVAAKTTN
jgi:hypothetical protein